MSDTKRYGMVEYNAPLIEGMDNRAEYIKAALGLTQPWLDRELLAHNYKVLADFYKDAYHVWKLLAGTTLSWNRKVKHDATEILRRAERALVLGVKAGQEAGDIGKQGEIGGWPEKEVNRGRRGVLTVRQATGIDQGALQELRPIGAISDEEFEKALAQARAQGRLSRASILRIANGEGKAEDWIPHRLDRTSEAYVRRRELVSQMAAEGHDSRQMAEKLGTQDVTIRQMARDMGVEIRADRVIARTKHLDTQRIITEAIGTLDGVVASLDLVDPWELDHSKIRAQRLALQRGARKIITKTREIRDVEEKDSEYASNGNGASPSA